MTSSDSAADSTSASASVPAERAPRGDLRVPPSLVRYELLHVDAKTGARRGRLHTPHGTIETPVFMPVGTAGSVKALSQADLEELGAQIIEEIRHQ